MLLPTLLPHSPARKPGARWPPCSRPKGRERVGAGGIEGWPTVRASPRDGSPLIKPWLLQDWQESPLPTPPPKTMKTHTTQHRAPNWDSMFPSAAQESQLWKQSRRSFPARSPPASPHWPCSRLPLGQSWEESDRLPSLSPSQGNFQEGGRLGQLAGSPSAPGPLPPKA